MAENNNIRSGVKKIFMTVFTQAIILVISVITGFILPQKMGPDNYGYWQIYVFYLSYLNLFGLGFNDGLALFYGGYEYEDLPFKRIRSSMRLFYVYLIFSTIILFFTTVFEQSETHQYIYRLLALSVPMSCILCITMTVFLTVNKTIVYNIINLITKIFAVSFYIILLVNGIISAKSMMTVDFISRVIVTIICIILGGKFLFGKSVPLKEGLQEFGEKSRAGINITIAVIASTLTPVLGRMVIEWNESIESYGIYSFAMSLLTIIMMFTTTAGSVIFPLLKKLSEQSLPNYYSKFAFICDSLIYLALFAYIPLLLIVKNIMIEYIPSLDYLYILLAMCLPLGRMQLLITPYYKAFRMEKQFLIANLIGVVSMFVMTFAMYKIFNSITAVAICTIVVLTIWTYCTERYLNRKINNKIDDKVIVTQIIMMVLFIFAGYFKSPLIFAAIYLPSIIIYFIINRQQTKNSIKQLKHS